MTFHWYYLINSILFGIYGYLMFTGGATVKDIRFNRTFTVTMMVITGMIYGFLEVACLPFLAIPPITFLAMIIAHTICYIDTTLYATLYDSGYYPLHITICLGIATLVGSLLTGKGVPELFADDVSRAVIICCTTILTSIVSIWARFFITRSHFRELYSIKNYLRAICIEEYMIMLLSYLVLVTAALPDVTWIMPATGLLILVIFFALFFLTFSFIIKVSVVEFNRIRQMDNQLKMQIESYNKQADYIRQFRKIRHDYKSQVMTLQILAQQKDIEKIDAYLKDMGEAIGSVATTYRMLSNNNLLDAILNDTAQKCREAGIEFDASFGVSGKLPLSDFDLSTLFINIFRNAREACSKEGVSPKFIRARSNRRGAWISFVISNSYNGVTLQEGDRFLTTKTEDVESHGLGIEKIREIVEANNGLITFVPNEQEKVFTVNVNFPLVMEEEEAS